jgi:DUF971 family protein
VYPISIKKIAPEILRITWNDGHETSLPLQGLRDRCPCAGCKGETVLLRSYVPPAPDTTVPGRYTLIGVDMVGSYAIQLTWEDGHNTGIYTWEYLEEMAKKP